MHIFHVCLMLSDQPEFHRKVGLWQDRCHCYRR